MTTQALSEYIKQEWQDLFADDFLFVDRTPSTWVRASAAAYRKHPELFSLSYLSTRHEQEVPHEELHKRFLLCEKETHEFEMLPFKERHNVVDDIISKETDSDTRDMLLEWKHQFSDATTPSAKQIRKVFFPRLRDKFNEKESNEGGGCFYFSFKHNGETGKLLFDFGGRRTFNYMIFLPCKSDAGKNHITLTYEEVLGIGDTNWSLLRTDQLEQDADYFIEVFDKLTSIVF